VAGTDGRASSYVAGPWDRVTARAATDVGPAQRYYATARVSPRSFQRRSVPVGDAIQ
jgi:hypothetical protein